MKINQTFLNKHKRYIGHLFFCVLFIVIASQKLAGFLLYAAIPFFILGCIFKLFETRGVSDKKAWFKSFSSKAMIWCVGFLIVFSVHQYYKHQIKLAAESVLTQVDSYYEKTGKYPTKESLNSDLLEENRIFYKSDGKHASLMYLDTFTIFATHSYNFEKKKWEYWAD